MWASHFGELPYPCETMPAGELAIPQTEDSDTGFDPLVPLDVIAIIANKDQVTTIM